MIKTSKQNNNRIIGISSDDFFNKNLNKTKTLKIGKNNNKKLRKNLSVEKPKKPIQKKEKNKIKPSSNSKSISLPDVFFEQILEYELQLKLKFDPKIFFELINLYSSAIKFYESIKNDKFITYNIGLNLLFSMPEAKSFMEGESMTKTEKKENIEKKMQQSEQKITKEKAENLYQNKINKNKKGKKIINEEFNKQSVNFKKRMEEKKKKYLSSLTIIPIEENKLETSDTNIKINSRNRNKSKNNNNKYRNKSVDIATNNIDKDEYFNDDEIIEAKKRNNFTNKKKSHQINLNISLDKNNFFDEFSEEKKDKENNEIKLDINNNNNKLSSFSGSGTDSEKDTLSFTTSDNVIFDISKFHKMTNKTLFKEKLKVNLDVYICQYYNKFVENTMNNIIDDYVKCGQDVENKLIENSVDFFNQRKELEALIKGDDSEENKNSTSYKQIVNAIDELKNDEKVENNKIIEEGENNVNNLDKKYGDIDKLNDEHYLDIIKEKLKLDVVKSLNSFILK